MDEIDWSKLEEKRVHGRLPDNYSVYKSTLGKDWDDVVRPRKSVPLELDIEIGMSQSGTLDKYVPDNGILDTLFDGLEDEIERVNKLMSDVRIR